MRDGPKNFFLVFFPGGRQAVAFRRKKGFARSNRGEPPSASARLRWAKTGSTDPQVSDRMPSGAGALQRNYRARIRTWTNRTKTCCATVTLPGNAPRGTAHFALTNCTYERVHRGTVKQVARILRQPPRLSNGSIGFRNLNLGLPIFPFFARQRVAPQRRPFCCPRFASRIPIF
jgi:hypothetical protein